MQENYIENFILRLDGEEKQEPTFTDDDCDSIYELKCMVQLKQIVKDVQNATHNRHDYVFKIVSIDKIKKE